jgi:GTPase SAR1 family protein
MGLPTKRTTGKMDVGAIRWLIYGPPGIGKTSLATGFPKSLLLATEKGYKSHKVFARDVTAWNDSSDKNHSFVHLIKLLVKGNHDYQTVVIDIADKLFDLCSIYVCDKFGIEHESEAEWGKGWAGVKKEFENEIYKLFATELGVIFISHTKTDEITTDFINIKKQVPTLSNQARKILLPLVDTIGYMRYRRKKISKGNFEEQFVITFKPSEDIEAKDRTGMLPPNLVLDVIPDDRKSPELVAKYAQKNYEKIAKYYK